MTAKKAAGSSEQPEEKAKELEPTIWNELRKKFPPEVVGKLPRGNTSLDFVGHAAVTDRLNSVLGPDNWDWQPLAFDDNGMPRFDHKGNLWIKLMVRESPDHEWVTRLGYGDGSSSPKELIGDAIRNAAMRFGVALDLWTKDELESTLTRPELKNKPAVGSPAVPIQPPADVMTPNQLKMMMALFNQLGLEDRDDRLKYISDTLGTLVTTAKELTKSQTASVINQLQADVDAQELSVSSEGDFAEEAMPNVNIRDEVVAPPAMNRPASKIQLARIRAALIGLGIASEAQAAYLLDTYGLGMGEDMNAYDADVILAELAPHAPATTNN